MYTWYHMIFVFLSLAYSLSMTLSNSIHVAANGVISCFLWLLLFSCSVVFYSLWPQGLQHPRLPSTSPSAEACSNLCPLSVMSSNHPIFCCPVLLRPSVFPSITSFLMSLCMPWPKYWSCSFNISPSNEYSGLVSFRIDWFDLLAVQGTLKSLLQHHSSKASVLQCSTFLLVQHSHPYMTPGKTIALTRWTFVGNVSAF